MPNLDQLTLLKKGISRWNRWKNKNNLLNPDHTADLRKADLSGADLSGADLSWANLSEANLSGANLSEANLSGAELYNANLYGANLNGADLREASLAEAYLRDASFHRADISEVDLSDHNLSGANLSEANLSGAALYNANLSGANLTKANLTEALIRMADLSEANLSGANLRAADLSGARLIESIFDDATLTESHLWGTQLSGWSIKNVICESVYWDKEKQEASFYKSGEFEKLYSETIKILLHYKDGINPLEIVTLPALIQHLEVAHPGCKLRFKSIKDTSGGAVVTVAIDETGDATSEEIENLRVVIQAEAARNVENFRLALKEKENLIQQLGGQVQALKWTFNELLLNQKPTYYLKQGDIKMGDEYNISGQAGAVGPNSHAHDNTFNQIVNQLEKSINLADLAQQLAELRQATTAKQDTSPQAAMAVGKLAEAEIAANEKNPSRVVQSLKAAGEWALDFAKEAGKEIAVEAIKQSMGMP